jgi:hypothetical protein
MNSIPRLGGRFMWQQAFNYIKNDNVTSIWMAQFDEVDEGKADIGNETLSFLLFVQLIDAFAPLQLSTGTAIFKVAATQDDIPAEGKWLTLNADGMNLPNDWYLRLTGEAQKMMRGEINLTDTIPISP